MWVKKAVRALGIGHEKHAQLGTPHKPAKLDVRLPARPQQSNPTRYLSIVAIVRDEDPYLKEWLEFHRLLGVEHVYLYNNGSTADSVRMLSPYVRDGYVTPIPWSTFDDEASPQRQAYAHAIANFGYEWRWMAFIDLDEFLFPVEGDSLVRTLSAYENLPAITVPCSMFGFSGHDTPPAGLTIENYTERAIFSYSPERRLLFTYKSIVNPAEVTAVGSVHFIDLRGADTAALNKAARNTHAATASVLRINHYYTRSRQEFERKLATPRIALPNTHQTQRALQKRQRIADLIEAETVHDDTIQRFLPALRERLGTAASST